MDHSGVRSDVRADVQELRYILYGSAYTDTPCIHGSAYREGEPHDLRHYQGRPRRVLTGNKNLQTNNKNAYPLSGHAFLLSFTVLAVFTPQQRTYRAVFLFFPDSGSVNTEHRKKEDM